MGVAFGIGAAILWGVGDYLITLLARRTSSPIALGIIQIFSLGAWVLILALSSSQPPADVRVWLLLILTGICHVVGLVFVYRAFEIGTLSLVSPISASFAVVTALLALTSGERPPWPAITGTSLLVGGILLATKGMGGAEAENKTARYRGIPEAIASALGFGAMFWLFYFFVEPALGYTWPLVVLKIMASIAAIGLIRRAKLGQRPSFKGTRIVPLALGAALADTLAWLAYIQGSRTEFAAVVTALASLFSVVTICLASILLREKLKPSQWVAVAIILFGILLVSV
jgi:drug/metabolite transporter (DMT)-like permease